MNNDIKCPIDKKEKYYLIPTNSWLRPYKKLITDELNEDGLLMISKLMGGKKIMVKITNGNNKKTIVFNNMLNKEQNFIETYCNFSCWENKNHLNSEYTNTNTNGYCETNFDNNESNHLITLEIMKKYDDGSLNKRVGSTKLKTYINIQRQIILAQIYAFDKYGFLHNDLHLANILVKLHDSNTKLKYLIKNNPYKNNETEIILETKIQIIITDFLNCLSYDPEIYKKYDSDFMNVKTFDNENTLLNKLVVSILNSVQLLETSDDNKIFNKLNEFIKTNEAYKQDKIFANKTLKNYYLKRIQFEEFKNKQCGIAIRYANELFNIITENKEILSDQLHL